MQITTAYYHNTTPTLQIKWKSTKPILCNAGMDQKELGSTSADYPRPTKGLCCIKQVITFKSSFPHRKRFTSHLHFPNDNRTNTKPSHTKCFKAI